MIEFASVHTQCFMIIEQEVSELIVGNYIVEITKPDEKYHLAATGWIKSDKTIETLRQKGVRRVMIDVSKQRGQPFTSGADRQACSGLFGSMARARELFEQSKEVQRKLLERVSSGAAIELDDVEAVISGTVDEVFENPDALSCVIGARIKDEYLLEHSIAVSVLMAMFARYMGFDKALAKELCTGAFLHDVGKVKIPEAILNKPGKLTASEFEVMKTHVAHSLAAMNEIAGISSLSLEVAAQHHEKLDAAGYPQGLRGWEVSIYGRMISICDIYDALTAKRCYKAGLSKVKAFAILRSLAEQRQLDARLVDSFIKCLGVYPIGAIVKLNSERLAMVEERNPDDAVRPKVRAFFDLRAQCFASPAPLDLAQHLDEYIVECVCADDFGLQMQQILDYLASSG